MAARIYLDHAATTPVAPAAADAMATVLAGWANPSSPHAEGRAARAALEDARRRIAAALGVEGWTIIFTSGASEALAIALARARRPERLVSAIEHDAVLRAAPDAARLPVAADGVVDLSPLDGRPPALVAVQQVNNETGLILSVDAAAIVAAGGLWLADASQGAGRLPLPQADFVALSGHKLGAPPGIGLLIVRDPALIEASGGQEMGYRGGTENLPAALALAAALEALPPADAILGHSRMLRDRLEAALVAEGAEVIAADAPRLPTISALRMPGVTAAVQLMQFDLAGIAVSAGAACSSGSMKPSHVLAALGLAGPAAREVIRVSFAASSTAAEVDALIAAWVALYRRVGNGAAA